MHGYGTALFGEPTYMSVSRGTGYMSEMGDGGWNGLASIKGALAGGDRSQARKVTSDTCVRDEQGDVGKWIHVPFFDGVVQSRLG